MADGQSQGEHEQVGHKVVRTASDIKQLGSASESFSLSHESGEDEHTGGPVRKSRMAELSEEEYDSGMLDANFFVTRKGLIEHVVMGSLP